MNVSGHNFILGDCLTVMKSMASESVDLIVTSPPYNLKNSTGNGMKSGKSGRWKNAALKNGYNSHSDDMPHNKYVEWQRNCLSEMLRLISKNGAIFYNHKWRVQNGILQDRADIVKDFPVRQIIIWKRSGGFNFNKGYFLPTYEVIYLIAKKGFKLIDKACSNTDVWEIRQEQKNNHPAPFPVELPEKCISSTSAEVILDPFSGSASTAIAAHRQNRKSIMIEKDPSYYYDSIARFIGEIK